MGSRMASKRVFKNIDEYIATFPKNVQSILEELRHAIKDSEPEAEESQDLRNGRSYQLGFHGL